MSVHFFVGTPEFKKMTHLEIATAYLAHTNEPTIQGLLGYIDAYDKTVLTLEQLNAVIATLKTDQLPLATSQNYREACRRNHDLALSYLRSTGVTDQQISAVLERFRSGVTKL